MITSKILKQIENQPIKYEDICDENTKRTLCMMIANFFLRNPHTFKDVKDEVIDISSSENFKPYKEIAEFLGLGNINPLIEKATAQLYLSDEMEGNYFKQIVDQFTELELIFLLSNKGLFITGSCPVQSIFYKS